MDINKIGKYLQEKRKEKNWTQGQLADLLGVSHQAVSRWENGDNLPDVIKLNELAVLYGVTVDSIINQEQEEVTKEKKSTVKEYSFISNIVSVFSLILYYVLFYVTRVYWIPVLVHYLIIMGISMMYLIPFARVQNKTTEDFKYVRYGMLFSVTSILISMISFVSPLYQLTGIVLMLFTAALVYGLNVLLKQYEEDTYGILKQKRPKIWESKIVQKYVLVIGASILIIPIIGFTTDLFFRSDIDVFRAFRAYTIFVILVFTITSIYLLIKQGITFKKILFLLSFINVSFITIYLMMISNKIITDETVEMFNNVLDMFNTAFTVMMILFLVLLILEGVKNRQSFKQNLHYYILIFVAIIAINFIYGYGSIDGAGSAYYYGEQYKLIFIFEEALVAIVVLNLVTIIQTLNSIKLLKS